MLIIFSFVFIAEIASAANILYLCALPSPSHHVWNSALANALAAQGHNVTVISPDKDNNPPKGVHYIHIDGIYDEHYRKLQKGLFDFQTKMNPLTEPINYDGYWYNSCKAFFKSTGIQQLLDYPDDFRFDLIVHDFTAGGCLLGFIHKFKYPPLVSVTAYGNPSSMNTFIGGHQFYSYIPHNYVLFQGDMSFWQRLYNFAVHVIEYYHHKHVFSNQINKLIAERMGPGIPSIKELEERTVIALVSTNPAIDYPASLPENVIPVGGLHVRDTKPLPKDLEEFINSSKKGAVLFSLGTNVRSSLMDEAKQKIILDAFALLSDYHFMWKFEETSIGLKLPKNVIIRPWMPQSDILAHPKVKAFFTHSGLLSTQETIWRGVPIVGMPFAYDQHRNLLKCVERGFAEAIDFPTMTTTEVKEKIQKVLEDPKYTENIKKLSKLYKDQKEKPIDRAVWWIEWLLRNPNAEHMKSPVLRLGYIVGNSYDLIAFITLMFVISAFVLFKLLLSCFGSRRNDSIKLKKN